MTQALKVQNLNRNLELICCKAFSITMRNLPKFLHKKISGLLSKTTLLCDIFHARFIHVRDIAAQAIIV